MLSTHIPGLSGDIVEVTDTLIVDTELQNMQMCGVTLMTSVAANEESDVAAVKLTQEPGTTQKLRIEVTKGGSAHGTAGDSAVWVSWWAHGR